MAGDRQPVRHPELLVAQPAVRRHNAVLHGRLWCGTWLSSHVFKDGHDLLQCALEGYYMLLFDLLETGGHESQYFHPMTVGSLLAISSHLVERMVRWPAGCMEDASEHHYGRVKSNVHYALPRCVQLFSIQKLHMQQKRCLEKPIRKSSSLRTPVAYTVNPSVACIFIGKYVQLPQTHLLLQALTTLNP